MKNKETNAFNEKWLKDLQTNQFYKDLSKFTRSGMFNIIVDEVNDGCVDVAWRVADLYSTYVQSILRDKDYGGCEDDPEFILMKFVIDYAIKNDVNRYNFLEVVSDASVLFDCEVYKVSHYNDGFLHYGEYFGYDERGRMLWFYSNYEDDVELKGLSRQNPYYISMPMFSNFGDVYVETILAHIICEPEWSNVLSQCNAKK